jgi:hypothetical protein
VLEYASHRELGTRRRVLELIGADTANDGSEKRPELIKLVEYVHWFSLGLVLSVVERADFGNGNVSGLPVTAKADELRDPPSSGV